MLAFYSYSLTEFKLGGLERIAKTRTEKQSKMLSKNILAY